MSDTRIRDAVFGLTSALVGLVGIWLTYDYQPKARHFPLGLSGVILLCGIAIFAGAFRRPVVAGEPAVAPSGDDEPENVRRAAEHAGMLRGALPFACVLVLWALGVSLGSGYLLPGFIAAIGMMLIAGARGLVFVVTGAAGTILFCFTMFYLVFQTRIPETPFVRSIVAPLRDLF